VCERERKGEREREKKRKEKNRRESLCWVCVIGRRKTEFFKMIFQKWTNQPWAIRLG